MAMRRCCARRLARVMGVVDNATTLPKLRFVRPVCTSIPLQAEQRVPRNVIHAPPVSIGSDLTAGPSRLPDVHFEGVETTQKAHLDAWTSIGVPKIIASRLLASFPHIGSPTPAQRAFILSAFRGKDVYLRDEMGRGKTLSIAIVVVSLAYRLLKMLKAAEMQGPQLVVLLPTRHLVNQVAASLLLLDPSFRHPSYPSLPHEVMPRLFTVLEEKPKTEGSAMEDPKGKQPVASPPASSLILLCTPKDFLAQKDSLDMSHIRSVIIDEPDSMLPSLPGRHINPGALHDHPINKHPPPLVNAINHILDIRPVIVETEPEITLDQEAPSVSFKKRPKRGPSLNVDFSHKRNIQTIWTSGTLDSAFRRFALTRGWTRGKEQLADLDFTSTASERQVALREEAAVIPGKKGTSPAEPVSAIRGVEPDHYAITVDDTGDMDVISQRSLELENEEDIPIVDDGAVHPILIESLAMLHTTSPPPDGSYALVVCPEGTSLDKLHQELAGLGVPSIHLEPEILQDVESVVPEDSDTAPFLIARRSVVPGLHLPRLHTVYLVGGLDVSETYKAAFIREKVGFYNVVAGRVGRLGTKTEDEPRQRVISIVPKDGRDEKVLGELFFGRYSVRGGLEGRLSKGEKVDKRWSLKHWDLAETERIAARLVSG